MNSLDLISDAPLHLGDERAIWLDRRLLLIYLADHVHFAELANGLPVRDATDFQMWLREMATQIGKQLAKPPSTEVQSTPELRTFNAKTVLFGDMKKYLIRRVKERRKVTRGPVDPTCPRCGHVHEGSSECGVFMGKSAGFCRCEMEVAV